MCDTSNTEVPKSPEPAKPEFNLFSSSFYLIAHAGFKFNEYFGKAIAKFGRGRTTNCSQP